MHNQFLLHLPTNKKNELLDIFNKLFTEGSVPEDWKAADIIPILKPGKNPTEQVSYRPISLLSCIGKVMERMVCTRLKWLLEDNKALLPTEFGFKKGKSTIGPA